MSEFWRIVIPVIITGIVGFILGYFSHKYKIIGDNISVKRDRLLNNIVKVEDFLSMLSEDSFLRADMERAEELIDSLQLNIETTNKEMAHQREELKLIMNEIQNGTSREKKKFLTEKLDNLRLRSAETNESIKTNMKRIKDLGLDIVRIKAILTDHHDRMIKDDIGSTIYIIDPTNQIAGSVKELQDISMDEKRHFFSDARVFELKGKINTFFNDQISKIR